MQVVRSLELLAGFCYTQFADTYQEVNGLLNGDRSAKIPIATIAAAVTGKGLGPERDPSANQPFLDAQSLTGQDPDGTLIIRPQSKR
jgi:hypothetical protein